MQLQEAKREAVKLRIGISGASGFGKTYSALLLAYGITGDYSKVAIIDTENGSGCLYADLGNYKVLNLEKPYSPERYIEAIELCEQNDIEVIIIDSITHEWTGKGGCLEIQEKLGGRFQDWAKVTPRHQAFIDKILQSKCHVITTVRRKVDYSLDQDQNGKSKVVKHGTKEITREGFEYELSVNFELINDNHLVKVSKDRTGLFMNKPEFVITPKTGERLLAWCSSDVKTDEVKALIKSAESNEELKAIYKSHPSLQKRLHDDFLLKLEELDKQEVKQVEPTKFSQNGTFKH